jgi:hypothetical protein
MQTALLAVIVFQFIYIFYSDIQNRKERADFQIKWMAKDLQEYQSVTEKTEDVVSERIEDPYISIDDANVDQILKAKEKA